MVIGRSRWHKALGAEPLARVRQRREAESAEFLGRPRGPAGSKGAERGVPGLWAGVGRGKSQRSGLL